MSRYFRAGEAPRDCYDCVRVWCVRQTFRMRRETWVVGPVATAVDLVVSLGAYVAGMTRDHLGMPRRVLNLPHCTNFNSLCVGFLHW